MGCNHLFVSFLHFNGKQVPFLLVLLVHIVKLPQILAKMVSTKLRFFAIMLCVSKYAKLNLCISAMFSEMTRANIL